MTRQAHAVVIGGGIMGVSVAYHLAAGGWADVILCEKGELTSGSTWHAAGQIAHAVGSRTLSWVNNYSIELYQRLEKETGAGGRLARLRRPSRGLRRRRGRLAQVDHECRAPARSPDGAGGPQRRQGSQSALQRRGDPGCGAHLRRRPRRPLRRDPGDGGSSPRAGRDRRTAQSRHRRRAPGRRRVEGAHREGGHHRRARGDRRRLLRPSGWAPGSG